MFSKLNLVHTKLNIANTIIIALIINIYKAAVKEENNSLRQGMDFDPRVDYKTDEQQNSLCPPKNNYYYLICAVSLSELLLTIIYVLINFFFFVYHAVQNNILKVPAHAVAILIAGSHDNI